jgi:hypothetical protein
MTVYGTPVVVVPSALSVPGTGNAKSADAIVNTMTA